MSCSGKYKTDHKSVMGNHVPYKQQSAGFQVVVVWSICHILSCVTKPKIMQEIISTTVEGREEKETFSERVNSNCHSLF